MFNSPTKSVVGRRRLAAMRQRSTAATKTNDPRHRTHTGCPNRGGLFTARKVHEMNFRWKVACINWSHPDAPHGLTHLLDGDLIVLERFFPTHAEALNFADSFARKETK